MLSQVVFTQNIDPSMSSECLRNFPDVGHVLPPETSQLRYIEHTGRYSNDEYTGVSVYHAVFPQMKFTCHGIITSYSALTYYSGRVSDLPYQMIFAVWRPRGLGVYDLVGYNWMTFHDEMLRDGSILIDNSTSFFDYYYSEAYFEFMEEPVQDEPILFQPGDVMGLLVDHGFSGARVGRLKLVYREATSGDTVNGYDAFTTAISTQSLLVCSVSECDAGVSRLSNIIPYFSVQYGK